MSRRKHLQVFVGNIPYQATEEELASVFSEVGPVVSFRIMTDRESGKRKGFGFAEYQDEATAQSALRNLNGVEIHGRALRVDRADGGGGGGGGGRGGGGGGGGAAGGGHMGGHGMMPMGQHQQQHQQQQQQQQHMGAMPMQDVGGMGGPAGQAGQARQAMGAAPMAGRFDMAGQHAAVKAALDQFSDSEIWDIMNQMKVRRRTDGSHRCIDA